MPEFPGSLSISGHTVTDVRKSMRSAASDPVAFRQLARLKSFTDWLDAQNKAANYGMIGEIGVLWYQDVSLWAGVMEALYQQYDAKGLSVLAWAAQSSNFYGAALATYSSKIMATNLLGAPLANQTIEPLNLAMATADSFETHASYPFLPAGGFRGVALTSGVGPNTPVNAATSTFSNSREPVFDGVTTAFGLGGTFTSPSAQSAIYNYGTPADFSFLASRGVSKVRLPIRWERVQRTLGGALDTTELARIDAAVAAANTQGIGIILDIHNFGNYYLDNGTQGVQHHINDGTVTFAHFTSLWTNLSAHYKGMAGIVGYEIMNEPYSLTAADWETASKNAVGAIRANNDTTLCIIEGGGANDYSTTDQWASLHPTDWMFTTDGGRTVTDAVINSTTTLTSATAAFTAADVGRGLTGPAGIPAGTRIASVTNATTVIMTKSATASATAQSVTIRGNYMFCAHQYLDFTPSGTYSNSYATEISNAQGAGALGFGYPLRSNSPTSSTFSFLQTTSTTPVPITGGSVAWAPSITFTGPPSGGVAVEAGIIAGISGTIGDTTYLVLLDNNGSVVKGSAMAVAAFFTDATTRTTQVRVRWVVTGLTPGTSYTYKLAYQVSNVRSTALVAWGGSSNPGDQGIFEIRPLAGAGYPGE